MLNVGKHAAGPGAGRYQTNLDKRYVSSRQKVLQICILASASTSSRRRSRVRVPSLPSLEAAGGPRARKARRRDYRRTRWPHPVTPGVRVASQLGFSFAAMIGGVRVLVVEDDARMAAAIRRGLRFEGLVVDLAGGGEEALRWLRATDVRRHRARRDDAGPRRLRDLPAAARRRRLGAGADADRARRGRGPGARARRRRRRLPDQAVLAGRAGGAAAGARPARARRAPDRARGRRAAARPGHARGAARRRRDRALGARVRPARDVHAPARPGVHPARSCSRRPGTSATSSARTWSRCTCATCARRSTGRSAWGRSRRVRGMGYRLRKDGGVA